MGNLSRAAKIGVGVFVAVALVVGVALGAYYGTRTSNDGPSKFGALIVKDKATGQQLSQFLPGTEVRLQYQSPAGHRTAVRYEIQETSSASFKTIGESQFGNFFDYTLSTSLFSTSVKFRVVDELQTRDFVDSNTLAVVPVFAVTAGAGLKSGQSIYRDATLSVTLELDTKLPAVNEKEDFAIDVDNSTVFGETEAAEILGFDATTKVLTWKTSTLLNQVYYRVRTTSLVTKGEPEELSYTLPFEVQVKTNKNCSPTDPVLCEIHMTNTSGAEGNFTAGEEVLLVVSFFGALPSGIAFSQSIDGATFLPIAPGTPTVAGQLASYPFTLGNIDTTGYQVRATNDPNSVTSASYTVRPVFSFTAPQVYSVWPTGSPRQNLLTTTVAAKPGFTGYESFSEWKVGYKNPTTQEVKIVKTVASATLSGENVEVTWSLDQADLSNLVSIETELFLEFQFQGSAGLAFGEAPTSTLFSKGPFVPEAAPIYQVGTNNVVLVESDKLLNLGKPGSSVPSFWLSADSDEGKVYLFEGAQEPPFTFSGWTLEVVIATATVALVSNSGTTFKFAGNTDSFTMTAPAPPNPFTAGILCANETDLIYGGGQACTDILPFGSIDFTGTWRVLP